MHALTKLIAILSILTITVAIPMVPDNTDGDFLVHENVGRADPESKPLLPDIY
ncbi:hypothetical protein CERSUDRAFT_93262 [Gelatoporia subvermispora B]|uniref:Uncharacterized protein n=1 Tax=Ceriporiopsis subvermispora (strain B) TaxID=914234 RepID=M2QQ55_CERS8|nr:hypothetical protein CERSUDRAFT_93262 [Gelatoporia subvermispora B]